MKNILFIHYAVILLMWSTQAAAQAPSFSQGDSPQSLQWVERLSGRLDSMLNDAMRGSEPIEILVRLTDK